MRRGRGVRAALRPTQRTDEHALERREAFRSRRAEGPIEVLFLGDSITRRLCDIAGPWETHFGRYAAANFAVGSDETGSLLWRIRNGDLEGLTPKLVVLLIGTNNAPRDSGRDIAAAIELILETIRRACPAAEILLLAILPRGPSRGESAWTPADRKTAKAIAAANRRVRARIGTRRSLAASVRFIDFSPLFLDGRGRTREDLMPDRLHPGRDGYAVFAPALSAAVADMLRRRPASIRNKDILS